MFIQIEIKNGILLKNHKTNTIHFFDLHDERINNG